MNRSWSCRKAAHTNRHEMRIPPTTSGALSVEPTRRSNMLRGLCPYIDRYRSVLRLPIERQSQRLDFGTVIQSGDDAEPPVLVQ